VLAVVWLGLIIGFGLKNVLFKRESKCYIVSAISYAIFVTVCLGSNNISPFPLFMYGALLYFSYSVGFAVYGAYLGGKKA